MNLASWIILVVLIIIVGFVLFTMIRNKKSGKLPCGCDCGNCGNCGNCGVSHCKNRKE